MTAAEFGKRHLTMSSRVKINANLKKKKAACRHKTKVPWQKNLIIWKVKIWNNKKSRTNTQVQELHDTSSPVFHFPKKSNSFN